jgi:hypothetical protein
MAPDEAQAFEVLREFRIPSGSTHSLPPQMSPKRMADIRTLNIAPERPDLADFVELLSARRVLELAGKIAAVHLTLDDAREPDAVVCPLVSDAHSLDIRL